MNNIKTLQAIVTGIVGGAICMAALWFLVPTPEGVEAKELYSPMGTPLTLMDAVIAIGGAALFLRALRNFKQDLRPAYQLMAYAQVCVGLCALLFPYIEYYSLWDNALLNMATYVGYFFGSILMYLSARKFFLLLGLRSKATSILGMVIVALAAWGLHALLPHVDSWGLAGVSELEYDIFELIPTVPVLFYGVAIYLAIRLRRKVGSDYRRAFDWAIVGLSLQWFSATGVAVMELIGFENWYFVSRAYAVPTILGDVALLCAAYHFNAIGLPNKSAWLGLWDRSVRAVTSLEIVTYTAGLVANPDKIDGQLDRMRSITSRIIPGEELRLTPEDERALQEVYLSIEQYLASGDDLRTYTREGVRDTVERHFRLDAGAGTNTFWPSLPAQTQ